MILIAKLLKIKRLLRDTETKLGKQIEQLQDELITTRQQYSKIESTHFENDDKEESGLLEINHPKDMSSRAAWERRSELMVDIVRKDAPQVLQNQDRQDIKKI